ncbi:MAG: hypothetical protein Q8O88_02925 [bacterium]|nr:hypothetical protein [bacterium]
MKESIYIQATRKAWHFAWGHKILWFFGIFAAFLGQFGMVEFLGKISVHSIPIESYFGNVGTLMAQVGKFVISAGYSFDSKFFLFFLLALIFSLVLVAAFVAVASQGLLLYACAQSIKGKKINIMKSWHVGAANFWRLFFLNFFKKIIIAVIAIILSLSAYGVLLSPSIPNSIALTLLVILLGFIGLVLSFLFFYSAGYVVIEKENLSVAIQKAWVMFVGHPIVSFEVGLLVVVLNLFFGLFAAFGFILFVLPAVLFWFVVVLLGGSQIALVSAFIASLIMFTMYIMVVAAGFAVFTSYIWTYVFLEMHDKGIKSRLMHFIRFLRGIRNKNNN